MSDAANDLPLNENDIDSVLPMSGAPADAADQSSSAAPEGATRGSTGGVREEAAPVTAEAISSDAGERNPSHASAPDASLLELPDLLNEGAAAPQTRNIDLLRDVDLHVKIELGRSRMFVEDVLQLGPGSVVELDKLAGDPVDVLVNERLVARGEVLVLNDNFCVRINEILSAVEDVA